MPAAAPGPTQRRAVGTRRTPPSGAAPVPPGGGLTGNLRRNLTTHAFLVGAVLCFAFSSWYPMTREFLLAFQKTEGGEVTWVGLDNLTTVVNDPAFWQAWRNTPLFTPLALVLGFAVPFAVAVVVNEFRHGKGYLRLLVYLPVMLPPVASVLVFTYLYAPATDSSTNCWASSASRRSSGSRTPAPQCSPSSRPG